MALGASHCRTGRRVPRPRRRAPGPVSPGGRAEGLRQGCVRARPGRRTRPRSCHPPSPAAAVSLAPQSAAAHYQQAVARAHVGEHSNALESLGCAISAEAAANAAAAAAAAARARGAGHGGRRAPRGPAARVGRVSVAAHRLRSMLHRRRGRCVARAKRSSQRSSCACGTARDVSACVRVRVRGGAQLPASARRRGHGAEAVGGARRR